MKNIDEQTFIKLERLLQEKEYTALSTLQQDWISNYLSVEQYNYSRKILLWSQESRAVQLSANASTTIKNRLDTAFASQYHIAWWSKKIPLYLLLLAVLLTGVLGWCLFRTTTVQFVDKEIVVYQVDTVVQSKVIYKDSIIEKPIVIEKIKLVKEPVYIRDTIYQSMPIATQLNVKEEPIQRYSLKESKELLEWTVKVD